jgi:hypothetical protein
MTLAQRLLAALYRRLLRLYPARLRSEFGDEMEAVFSQGLAEAGDRGRAALLQFLWLELSDLPPSLVREHLAEKHGGDMTAPPETPIPPLSWPATAAGVWPFLIGLLAVLWGYPHPPSGWRTEPWAQTLQAAIILGSLLLGFGLGWLRQFPRWSYPYTAFIFTILLFLPVGNLLNSLALGLEAWLGLGLAFLWLGGAGLLWLARRWKPLQPLYWGVRLDWTQACYGMSVVASIFFTSIDHDEDPFLALDVILPGLLLALAALVYLRLRTRKQRLLALGAGIFLATCVRVIAGHPLYAAMGLFGALVMFSPAMLAFFPPPEVGTVEDELIKS